MSGQGRAASTFVSPVLLIACAVGVGTAAAKIVVPSGSVIEVDEATVTTVVNAFALTCVVLERPSHESCHWH